jgi:hypothetical protein
MARIRREAPREWMDVRSDDGTVIGSYAVRNVMITVRYPGGGQKVTTASAVGENVSLARLMLSEPPPR